MQYILNDDVRFILDELNKHNFEAYLVGGCVRDILLGREPKDFDITTSAKPLEIKNIFRKTIDTGIEHGTVTVVLNKQNYEVTTYRIDGNYKDNRRPESVSYTTDLREDLLRRDFTINAIAYHYNKGFIDPFDGKKDLELKIIRGVGDPDKRFKEDALRMLRSLRFKSQLCFNIEPNTYSAVIQNASLIKNISIERIRDEVFKLILGDDLYALNLLLQTKILTYVNIELSNYLEKNTYFIIKCLNLTDKNINNRLIIFFHAFDLNKLESILRFLKLDNKTIKQIKIIVTYLNYDIYNDCYRISKLVNKIGKDNFLLLLNIKQIIYKTINNNIDNNILETLKTYDNIKNNPFEIKDLNLNGNDILNMGIENGAQIGQVLNSLMDKVLKEPLLNDKNILTNLAMEYKNKLKG